jgi:hypothetical protein
MEGVSPGYPGTMLMLHQNEKAAVHQKTGAKEKGMSWKRCPGQKI